MNTRVEPRGTNAVSAENPTNNLKLWEVTSQKLILIVAKNTPTNCREEFKESPCVHYSRRQNRFTLKDMETMADMVARFSSEVFSIRLSRSC